MIKLIPPKRGQTNPLSQKVAVNIIKSKQFQAFTVEEAKEQRRQIARVARGFFEATVKGASRLVTGDSGMSIPVKSSPKLFRHRERDPYRFSDQVTIKYPDVGKDSFNPTGDFIKRKSRFVDGREVTKEMKVASLPDSVVAELSVRWRPLSDKYVRFKSPLRDGGKTGGNISHFFWRKDKEAAAAIRTYAAQFKTTPSQYQKGAQVKFLESPRGVKYTFALNFPKLDAALDFVRGAFVKAGQSRGKFIGPAQLDAFFIKDTHQLRGLSRIQGAEKYRPLLVPYAQVMGVEWGKLLRRLDEYRGVSNRNSI